MPYLRLDVARHYPAAVKRALAERLCRAYADVMRTRPWRPNVGIAELGEDNLLRLGPDGLEPVTMVVIEIRRGRPPEQRLALGREVVKACVEVLGVEERTVIVEFSPHDADEILRDGDWTNEWSASAGD